jgi:hypothetical protein
MLVWTGSEVGSRGRDLKSRADIALGRGLPAKAAPASPAEQERLLNGFAFGVDAAEARRRDEPVANFATTRLGWQKGVGRGRAVEG